MYPDVNECMAATSPCDANAECTNSAGSFSCSCNTGFTGDGMTCNGKSISSNRVIEIF